MESRVNKYSSNDTEVLSRTKKNQRLYSEINDLENKPYDINSNSVILGNNSNTIDIDKLKDMLDKQYKEDIKNKSLASLDGISEAEKISLDETREYDINAILTKAKETRQSDYEEDRLKKLRNTQLDILNDLNIEKKSEEETNISVSKEEGNKLKSLIDTINLTEETNAIKNIDPLDLLSDLKGNNDETKVSGVQELTQEILKKAQELDTSEIKKVHDELKEDLDSSTLKLDNLTKSLKGVVEDSKKSEDSSKEDSFYTTSSVITQDDFDDFSDLKDDISATKIIVKILIVVVIIAFIVGVVFLLNKILEWGLF